MITAPSKTEGMLGGGGDRPGFLPVPQERHARQRQVDERKETVRQAGWSRRGFEQVDLTGQPSSGRWSGHQAPRVRDSELEARSSGVRVCRRWGKGLPWEPVQGIRREPWSQSERFPSQLFSIPTLVTEGK